MRQRVFVLVCAERGRKRAVGLQVEEVEVEEIEEAGKLPVDRGRDRWIGEQVREMVDKSITLAEQNWHNLDKTFNKLTLYISIDLPCVPKLNSKLNE
jgi:hypothetical protein